MLEMWSEHKLKPLDSQPWDDSREPHSVTHFSNKCMLVSPGARLWGFSLEQDSHNSALWNLYYILSGAHYACKITIAFYLPSALKFTKCIHAHYLILNKFTVLPDA